MSTKESRRPNYHEINQLLISEYKRRWTPQRFAARRSQLQADGRPAGMRKDIYLAYMTSGDHHEFRRAIGGLVIKVNNGLITRTALRLEAKIKDRSVLEFADLVQEGREGMLKALEGFSTKLGHAFSTYALWWVRAKMTRAIEQNEQPHASRLPGDLQTELQHLLEVREVYSQRLMRLPTNHELVTYIMEHQIKLGERATTEPRLRLLLHLLNRSTTSIDAEDSEKGKTLHELIPKIDLPSPEDYAMLSAARRQITARVRRILNLIRTEYGKQALYVYRVRMGFDGDIRPLRSIADEYSVSRERIRQIEAKCSKLVCSEFGLTREEVRDMAERLGTINCYHQFR